ncbi:T9SS type A sorting domain-containing protein [Hymenobacter chitinivorans]|uniref:Putative secreted protein (Por secretion system target) n=1 Tax=Hymenobacter chitinivorans DSM 11115 TaxID=1121954 RepID=A0A2M9BLX9_9BACT|nr:T9SS type A sorting domain-containing protein [Hymenobacter chitinivorans]PJJ58964.1 putative secreted protein (Por secretion system target) [Hymenobacter chitinivorans DSM 11115]
MKHFLPQAIYGFFLVLLTGSLATAQAQALYVNDGARTGDVYTSAAGNDATGNGSTTAPFATVAKALASADGATTTIFIDAGTYPERVVLNKNINLQGVDTARTVFDGGLAPSDVQTRETGIFITATGGTPASPVTIADLKVRAYDYGIQCDNQSNHVNFLLEDVATTENRQFGIYWNGYPNYTENITFRRVRATKTALDPNTRNNGAGRGLFLVNGSKINILIEDGVFEQNRRAGIDVNDGSVSGLVIRGCRLGFNLGPAIAVLGAAGLRDGDGNYTTPAALIENNFVRNNASNGLELKSCTGTGLSSGPGSFVVRNNYVVRTIGAPTNLTEDNAGIAFIDRDRNIIVTGGGVTSDLKTGGAYIANNIVRGYLADALRTFVNINGFGVVLEGGNNKVFGNVIAQCQRGVQVQDRPANSSSSTPFFDIDRNASLISSADSIRNNRLDSCTTAVRAVNLANVLNASLNWLGKAQATAIRGTNGQNGLVITLGGPSTNFAQVSSLAATGRVDYSPFMHTGTDAADATGFQCDVSYVHVDGFSPNAGASGRLQEGLTAVSEGGTVEAVATTYAETATIEKSLRLTNDGATTIQNLVLNAPGKTATLGAAFDLSGVLTLTNGLLSTSPAGLLTLLAGASATTGNTGSYVSGPLRKLGNTGFVFPVGKAGVWARMGISAPATAASAFTAEYFAAPYANQTATDPLKRVSAVEYWTLDRTGSTDAVSVQLFWEDGGRSGIDDFSSNLQVARFDGSTWVTAGNGGLGGSQTAGSVASAAPVATMGPFTLGSATPPLPVELISFTAQERKRGTVVLDWRTASERNNKGFAVERSFDAKTWQQLAFVAGHGTTSTTSTYSYLDQTIGAASQLYYRLRQIDFNGQVSISPVVSLTRDGGEARTTTVALAPNPASSYTVVQLSAPATGPLQVTVTDLTGRLVLQQALIGANSQLRLPAALPAGTYLVRVNGAGITGKALRLVKQ